MSSTTRAWWAVAALAAITGITASWWALALWPVAPSTPEWFLRTREVCFGAAPGGLPDAGGWILLVGQPLGMILLLAAGWPGELRAGFGKLTSRVAGQVAVGVVGAAVVTGLGGVVVRVAGASVDTFSAGSVRDIAASLTRVDDAPPAFQLTDQHGRLVGLDAFRGRPVLVTFAFAHCETVCPTTVADVLEARARLTDASPAVLVITLDPWRDTPSRLPALASAWRLTGDAHALSGDPDVVERVLNSWRIPRVRNEKTGDLSHPALIYVISPEGRIVYVVGSGTDAIVAAVRAL